MKQSWMELGRSMVEMLGVLAVIGVLSIVGITGYKKAMNKIRANEVLDIAMKVQNENLAWLTLHPNATTSTASLCSNAVPSNTTNDTVKTLCERNLGMEKPSWATFDSFSVRSNVLPNDPVTYRGIFIYGMSGCDVCKEIGNMYAHNSTYAYISGTSPLIRIYCYGGTDTNPMSNNKCFQ